MSNIFKWLAMLMLATIIAACGGGSGGGGDGSPAVPPAPGSSPVTINFPTSQGLNVLMPGESVSFEVSYLPQAAAAGKALTATSSVPVALSLNGAAPGTYSFNESNFDLTIGATKIVILTIDPAAGPSQFSNTQLVANVAGYQTSTPIDLKIVSATEASITFNSNGLDLSTESSAVVNLVASGFTGGDAGARVVALSTSNEGITVSPATCTVSQNLPVCPVVISSTTTAGNFQIKATTPGGVLQVTPLNVSVLERNSIGFNPDSITLLTKGSGGLESTTVTLYANQLDKATTVTIDNSNAHLNVYPTNCKFAIGSGSCQVTITSLGDVSGDYTITAITPDGYTVPSLAVHIDTPGSLAFNPAGLKMFAGESYAAKMEYTTTSAESGTIPVTFTATPGVSVNTGESNPLVCTITVQDPVCSVVITAESFGLNSVTATEPAGTTITPLAVEVNGFASIMPNSSTLNCALDRKGYPYCWGNGAYGVTGNPTATSTYKTNIPNNISMSESFVSLVATSDSEYPSVCGLTPGGNIYCWGSNFLGQLGNGTVSDRSITSTPQLIKNVNNSTPYSQIAAGRNGYCALDQNGQAWCWGLGSDGELGGGDVVAGSGTPIEVLQKESGIVFDSLVATSKSFCGLDKNQQTWCWGANSSGQIGNHRAVNVNFASPQKVEQGVNKYVALFTNSQAGTVCGNTSLGKLYCWGNGAAGQLGNNSYSNESYPQETQIPNGVAIKDVSIGSYGTNVCALSTTGSAYCWGNGVSGQIGNGLFITQAVPQIVQTLVFNAIVAAFGNNHVCGLTAAGETYCWGQGLRGGLGNGGDQNSALPLPVTQGGVSYQTTNGSCGLSSGVMSCWGYGYWGYNGNGSFNDAMVPNAVITPPVVEVE